MMINRSGVMLLIFLCTILACVIKKNYDFRKLYSSHNEIIHDLKTVKEKPFLKAHMSDGSVCIFENEWEFDSLTNMVSGIGKYYDFQRKEVLSENLNINIDSVALFETNTKLQAEKSDRIQKMAIFTAMDVILGVLCLTMPKACFGSCPTFYIDDGHTDKLANAESFSNAISPSLAYSDVDDLRLSARGDTLIGIKMLNEALETHVVENVNLHIVEKNVSEDVFITSEEKFLVTESDGKLRRALSSKKEITSMLAQEEGIEYFSLADNITLVSKEEIILEFDDVSKAQHGLKLTFRQTLMTTYALYSAIGYMGDEVGDMFAKIERSDDVNKKMQTMFYDALGGIEVYSLQPNNQWKYEGEMYETGPISRNNEIVELCNAWVKDNKLKLKLVMNKGLWRIDNASLHHIKKEVTAKEIKPMQLIKNGKDNKEEWSKLISNKKQSIISMPGDNFYLKYEIPSCDVNQNYSIFLNGKGYYLEWMRESWLKEKNLYQLNNLMTNPKDWLNSETANYKKYESEMEKQFWNSRWTQQNKSYESL